MSEEVFSMHTPPFMHISPNVGGVDIEVDHVMAKKHLGEYYCPHSPRQQQSALASTLSLATSPPPPSPRSSAPSPRRARSTSVHPCAVTLAARADAPRQGDWARNLSMDQCDESPCIRLASGMCRGVGVSSGGAQGAQLRVARGRLLGRRRTFVGALGCDPMLGRTCAEGMHAGCFDSLAFGA